ncbi:toxin-antitoxin system YwqK family antitoxin [Glaciecola sp. MH2013]|uniref:toxin-antitoxin system YwqK family antitoxin n=1 Tax=Glaciecola sp. MH2013 TaxID=2785524 RepID=UPI001E52098F|nr:toxin-antitoxin system YwqK family antitoxin [Glaciecola sp. MH2013]
MLTRYKVLIALSCSMLILGAVIYLSIMVPAPATLYVDKSAITFNERGQRLYKKQPFSGTVYSHHSNGDIATEDQFVNGRREGFARKWFVGGILGYESFYLSNARDGVSRTWWFDGTPRSEFFYVNGKPEGTAWQWYRSGNKFKKFHYKDGKPSGLQQAWRENGKLVSNFEYKNGRIYGLKKANSCVGLEDEQISFDYYKVQASISR